MLLVAGLDIVRASIPPIHGSLSRHLDWSPVQHVQSHSHTRVFSYCGRKTKPVKINKGPNQNERQRTLQGTTKFTVFIKVVTNLSPTATYCSWCNLPTDRHCQRLYIYTHGGLVKDGSKMLKVGIIGL